jgi:hypothetical protein
VDIVADPDPYGSVSFWVPIRSRGCSGSGSVSYSSGTKKFKERENLPKNTFCVGPVGPNDKENYITSLKR